MLLHGLRHKMKNKKSTKSNCHEFAFYYQDLTNILLEDIDITLISDDLYHRLKYVVRMKQDDTCIIFNQVERVVFMFSGFEGKNRINGTWQKRQKNDRLTPEITFILPLLKIDALSDSIYSLSEVGITKIQLVSTHKTQTPCSDKLLDKLQRVAVAAAEQSKMYAFPTILPSMSLDEWLSEERSGLKYHFDVTGVPFDSWYRPIQRDEKYYLLVGPEGDLTNDEKLLAKNAGFQSCLLTSTVLRSVRSISLVSGLFRL